MDAPLIVEHEFDTEVWFRNPDAYGRELAEVGVGLIAWDRGYLVKKRVDPCMHAELFVGDLAWRVLAIGPQGTAEYRPGNRYGEPSAVYPTFAFGDDADKLEEWAARPVGQDETACNDPEVEPDLRPRFGQEHRIVITDIPSMSTGVNRGFLKLIAELQQDYPECIFHVHGLYGYRTMFGRPYRSVDYEARTSAQKGKVVTPAGRELPFERLAAHAHWATMLNMKPSQLAIPRERCMYNIRSAIWAGQNFRKDIQYRVRGKQTQVDHDLTEVELAVASKRDGMSENEQRMADEVLEFMREQSTGVTHTTTKPKRRTTAASTYRARKGLTRADLTPAEGDYFHCDTCSLAMSCKFYREGSVCSVPTSETSQLVKLFGSRNSDKIIDGLGRLLEIQASRIEDGQELEAEFGEINPEVNKLINSLFTNGVKLAKLIDPSLNGGPKVNVNVGVGAGGQASVVAGSPNQLMGAIVRELESRGVPREQITPEMIQGMLEGMSGSTDIRPAIEGTAVYHNRD